MTEENKVLEAEQSQAETAQPAPVEETRKKHKEVTIKVPNWLGAVGKGLLTAGLFASGIVLGVGLEKRQHDDVIDAEYTEVTPSDDGSAE